jgi:hypothetical protein
MVDSSRRVEDIPIPAGDSLQQVWEEWPRAFVAYLAVAADPTEDAARRASAWARMGDMVGAHPVLAIGDNDTGLFYYRRALELDPACPLAWFGVLQEYGPECPNHSDRNLFERSIEFFKTHEVVMSLGCMGDSWKDVVRRRTAEWERATKGTCPEGSVGGEPSCGPVTAKMAPSACAPDRGTGGRPPLGRQCGGAAGV